MKRDCTRAVLRGLLSRIFSRVLDSWPDLAYRYARCDRGPADTVGVIAANRRGEVLRTGPRAAKLRQGTTPVFSVPVQASETSKGLP